MSSAIGLLPIPAGAHAAPASASTLGNVHEEPSTSRTRPHPVRRQRNERFDGEQGQRRCNGLRLAKRPGHLRHSGIHEGHDLGTHATAGLSQERSDSLGRRGITNRDRIERVPHVIANTVNRSHKFIAGMGIELASISGRNKPCGPTPGTDIANGLEQFVIGGRLFAMKHRVRQVEYDMAADEVTGLPRRDESR